MRPSPSMHQSRRSLPLAASLLLASLAACSNAGEERRIAQLVPDDVTFHEVSVCSGTGCTYRHRVRLDETDWGTVDVLFVVPPESPADERRRIGLAIGIMEILVGPQAGTKRDVGRNVFGRKSIEQLDCVDEAVNTTTYLRLMEARGLLRYHRVGTPANRIIELLNAHNAAVIIDIASGRSYAVDSWFYDNGSPAVVLPLETWRAGWDPLYGDTVPPDPDSPPTQAARSG